MAARPHHDGSSHSPTSPQEFEIAGLDDDDDLDLTARVADDQNARRTVLADDVDPFFLAHGPLKLLSDAEAQHGVGDGVHIQGDAVNRRNSDDGFVEPQQGAHAHQIDQVEVIPGSGLLGHSPMPHHFVGQLAVRPPPALERERFDDPVGLSRHPAIAAAARRGLHIFAAAGPEAMLPTFKVSPVIAQARSELHHHHHLHSRERVQSTSSSSLSDGSVVTSTSSGDQGRQGQQQQQQPQHPSLLPQPILSACALPPAVAAHLRRGSTHHVVPHGLELAQPVASQRLRDALRASGSASASRSARSLHDDGGTDGAANTDDSRSDSETIIIVNARENN